jgi:hypothetical protein
VPTPSVTQKKLNAAQDGAAERGGAEAKEEWMNIFRRSPTPDKETDLTVARTVPKEGFQGGEESESSRSPISSFQRDTEASSSKPPNYSIPKATSPSQSIITNHYYVVIKGLHQVGIFKEWYGVCHAHLTPTRAFLTHLNYTDRAKVAPVVLEVEKAVYFEASTLAEAEIYFTKAQENGEVEVLFG